jgi:hypothetical protein
MKNPCARSAEPGTGLAAAARSAEPGTGLAAPDVVRRLVERRVPELDAAGLAGHQQVPHAPAAFGSLLRRSADAGFPADPGLAGPQRVAERAALRLVLEQGHRHEMIMPAFLVLALVRRKNLTRSGPLGSRAQVAATGLAGWARLVWSADSMGSARPGIRARHACAVSGAPRGSVRSRVRLGRHVLGSFRALGRVWCTGMHPTLPGASILPSYPGGLRITQLWRVTVDHWLTRNHSPTRNHSSSASPTPGCPPQPDKLSSSVGVVVPKGRSGGSRWPQPGLVVTSARFGSSVL